MISDPEENYIKAVKLIREDGARPNTSYLQRKMGIGYNQAARHIDRMEQEGIVSKANHIGHRQLLPESKDGGSNG